MKRFCLVLKITKTANKKIPVNDNQLKQRADDISNMA